MLWISLFKKKTKHSVNGKLKDSNRHSVELGCIENFNNNLAVHHLHSLPNEIKWHWAMAQMVKHANAPCGSID